VWERERGKVPEGWADFMYEMKPPMPKDRDTLKDTIDGNSLRP